MTQEVLKAQQPIAVYDPFRAQLVELREINAKTVFDYENPKGNKDARSHIYKLRQTKSAVEKARKAEKDDALTYGRRVDAEAKEIKDEIDGMIAVHAKPLEEIERREEERKAKHQQAIGHMAKMVTDAAAWMSISADVLQDWLTEMEAVPTGEAHWQEFAEEAGQAREAAIKALGEAVTNRRQHDEEQAELARLRREAEERERQEMERQAEERRQREAAERKAEEERIAKEAAERATREAEEKAKRDLEERQRRERAEAEARENNKRHRAVVNNKAKDAMVAGGLSEEAAKTAITLIAERKVPGVTIVY